MDITKHNLYRLLNSYGDNVRRIWSSCCSTYCTCATWCVVRTLCRSVLEPVVNPSHTEASVLGKEPGTLRTAFIELLRVL